MTSNATIRAEINRLLDDAEARGMKSYGKPLEEATDRDWMVELIQELIDGLYYAAKEIKELREKVRTPFD